MSNPIELQDRVETLLAETDALHLENGSLVSENCKLKDELLTLYRRLDIATAEWIRGGNHE